MILDKIKEPNDLKKLTLNEKKELSLEIRNKIIDVVSKNGGHLASNLGVIDLTIALYSTLNMPKDKVIWDVGHQCYTHKILTGRKNIFDTLRKYKGISGFPKIKESIYDSFDVGHSSTSISIALGMARARDIKKEKEKIIAIIGDGAMTSGISLEAINDAGCSKTNLIVILNDNEMSISENSGGFNKFLARLRTRKFYIRFDKSIKIIVKHLPFGKHIYYFLSYIKRKIKGLFISNMYFENIGFTYLGPVNGHSIKDMEDIFKGLDNISGPVLVHIITKKGNGYTPAVKNPDKYHAVGPFDINTGKQLKEKQLDYSHIFGRKIVELAKENKNIIAITAAMEDGTGLTEFAKLYPKRFFNVEICEEHALTMAAGMAKEGMIPIVVLYSSFMQRGYDEIVHDICLTKQHVILLLDRAGNTGQDGETHHGIYDLSYLNTIPNLTILAPKNFNELELMLEFAIKFDGPIAIRYPKGREEIDLKSKRIVLGKSEILRNGKDITIVAIGKMVARAYRIANKLKDNNIDAEVINARFLKPLDTKTIIDSFNKTKLLVTLEDNDYEYGFGATIKKYIREDKVLSLGYPNTYLEHGSIDELEKKYYLDENSIYEQIIDFYNTIIDKKKS